MTKLSEYFGRDSAYWGERGDWLVAAVLNRDSDCLTRSNYRSFVKLLGGKGTEGNKGNQDISDTVAIEEAKHWACGWIQYLIINPTDTGSMQIAESTRERLEDYPVVDDDDFSELEMEEANEVWQNCYQPKERVEYVRKHRNQFEFRDFQDMIGCIRGRYFAGYASELIN